MKTATPFTLHLGSTLITVKARAGHFEWTVAGAAGTTSGSARDEKSAWETALYVDSPLGQAQDLARSVVRARAARA